MLNDPRIRDDERIRYFNGEARDWLVAKDDFRLKDYTTADFARECEYYAYERKLVAEMFRVAVAMLAGTDMGNSYVFPGLSLHDALELMFESGESPLGALQAATSSAALFVNAADRFGSVTPGKIADLMLLDAEPLADIHNTTRIAAVVAAGKAYDRVALDALLNRAADAAALTDLACESGRADAARALATLERLDADDYGKTDVRGSVLNHAARLDFVRDRKSELKIDCDGIGVRLYGDAAVVTGAWEYTP